jgi:preprotein translocase subunit SecG
VSQGSLSYFEKRGQGLHIEKVVAVLAVLGFALTLTATEETIAAEETVYPEVEATGAEQVQP